MAATFASAAHNGAKSVREQVGEEEWKVRVDLAACYRLVAKLGMSDLIYNHITAKVPGAAQHFLINAYGLMYPEVTASNLYKIDLAGNVILEPALPDGEEIGINKAGFVIHSSVHAARPDIGCVIHTHSRAGVAVSAMDCGLLPISQFALLHSDIAYHDYGVPAQAEEGEAMVRSLGRKNYMILRNHGLLICGRTVAEAFRSLYWIEQACRIQVDVMAAGAQVRQPGNDVVAAMAESSRRPRPGRREWSAMLRMLDREDPGYRE